MDSRRENSGVIRASSVSVDGHNASILAGSGESAWAVPEIRAFHTAACVFQLDFDAAIFQRQIDRFDGPVFVKSKQQAVMMCESIHASVLLQGSPERNQETVFKQVVLSPFAVALASALRSPTEGRSRAEA